MPCCPSIQEVFNNVPSTSIPYGPDRQLLYGLKPFVQVIYFIDGQYILSNNFSAVTFGSDNIIVDHGGLGSGFITIR